MTPFVSARIPVRSGTAAVPTIPKLHIHPIAPDKICAGMKLPHWFIMIGNIGPKTRPTREIAIAEGMRRGTAQMKISSLGKI